MLAGLGALAALIAFIAPPVAWPDADLERAISLAAENRREESRAVLDPLLEHDPVHPRARLLHGILRAREGLVDEAIAIFERLRKDHPDLTEAWNNLAVLYAAKGMLDEARETLLLALERRPSAVAYANLGDVYTTLARHAYVRARELGRDGSGRPAPGARIGEGPAPPASSAPAAGPGDAPAAGAASLEIPLSEADPPGGARAASGAVPRSEPADRSAPGAAPERSPTCVRAGGFEDRRVLVAVEEWLRAHGAEDVEVHRVTQAKTESYQVYLPPFATRAEAVETARAIQAGGVRDVAVIGHGPLANGVSLGVFRLEENLHRRIAALAAMGHAVHHRENRRTAARYVLAARAGPDPDALRAAWGTAFPKHPIELASCEPPPPPGA